MGFVLAKKQSPMASPPPFAALVRPCTTLAVKRTLASWGCTWRQTCWVHRNKYTDSNMDDWARYAELISSVHWRRVSLLCFTVVVVVVVVCALCVSVVALLLLFLLQLKFIDESLDLARKRRVGPKGRELIVVDGLPANTRYSPRLSTRCTIAVSTPTRLLVVLGASVTPLTRLPGSNMQWDFFNFVSGAITEGYIGFGDLVVVDNASVHVGQDMFPYLIEMLDVVSAFLVRLPTYLPECDPCELVFVELKESLHERHEPGMSLPARVYAGLQCVLFDHIWSYYWRCTSVGRRRLAAGF
jgi:hypothetical protein